MFGVPVRAEAAFLALGAKLEGEYVPCSSDPESWFEPGRPPSWVKEACETCIAYEECQLYALLAGEKWGTWGAQSELERKKFKRETKEQGSYT